MHRWTWLAAVVLGMVCIAPRANASDEAIVLDQEYNVAMPADAGAAAKNSSLQKLYLHSDFLCVDQYASTDTTKAPVESILIDFKKQQIVSLNHDAKKKVTETFDGRRKTLEDFKTQAESELAKAPAGPEKDKAAKLYRALLDDECNFVMFKDSAPNKTLLGQSCRVAQVVDAKAPDYMPVEASLHPTLELPYENTEVFYLLGLVGKQMSRYMASHRKVFKYVPLELHMDLPTGGKMETKVVKVEKVDRASLAALRGALGNPFEVPAYDEAGK